MALWTLSGVVLILLVWRPGREQLWSTAQELVSGWGPTREQLASERRALFDAAFPKEAGADLQTASAAGVAQLEASGLALDRLALGSEPERVVETRPDGGRPAPPSLPWVPVPGAETVEVLDPHEGWIQARGFRFNGQRIGPWTEYHPNGKPASEGEYEENNRHGFWRFWSEDGQVLTHGQYVRGQRTGRWVSWHPNGELRREGEHRNGARTGLWREWYSNGQIKEAGYYALGRREGFWRFYHFDGSEDLRTGEYRSGIRLRE